LDKMTCWFHPDSHVPYQSTSTVMTVRAVSVDP
jgi:hypothetical protein